MGMEKKVPSPSKKFSPSDQLFKGLRKLQLIKEAKAICPDLIIVLGEDLTPFRNASRLLYNFIRTFSWNSKIERLGLDEVFLDVSDIVEYNLRLLGSDFHHAFFHIDEKDPIRGWPFDATTLAGHAFPPLFSEFDPLSADSELRLRLNLASHLALHIRSQLEAELGYTCTVGISTSKLLSKLIGTLHKPCAQTTLLPPYHRDVAHGHRSFETPGNVNLFINQLEIRKVPGIGSNLAKRLRNFAFQYVPNKHDNSQENHDFLSVGEIKSIPKLSPAILEQLLLHETGSPSGVGQMVWNILHGVDTSPVKFAQNLPKQISIEDSYGRIDSLVAVTTELAKLSRSLITRMRTDLYDSTHQKWHARPKTLRLSTRPSRYPATISEEENQGATTSYSFHGRVSRSTNCPAFLFSVAESVDQLATRLVSDHLLPLFKGLHPGKDWAVSLLNVAVTNIDDGAKEGRDIQSMFQNQKAVLKEWQITEDADAEEPHLFVADDADFDGDDDDEESCIDYTARIPNNEDWMEEDEDGDQDGKENSISGFESTDLCPQCGICLPSFALVAHERYHSISDETPKI